MIIKNIVYGLRDPRNDVYYYIGKSSVGMKRPMTHLVESHSEKVNAWVTELKEKGYFPLIDIIEEVEDLDDLSEREKYWIAYYYEINPNLLNSTSLLKKEVKGRKVEDKIDLESVLEILKMKGNYVGLHRMNLRI
jgi:hypothetical protein